MHEKGTDSMSPFYEQKWEILFDMKFNEGV